jgi:hypothetical protein
MLRSLLVSVVALLPFANPLFAQEAPPPRDPAPDAPAAADPAPQPVPKPKSPKSDAPSEPNAEPAPEPPSETESKPEPKPKREPKAKPAKDPEPKPGHSKFAIADPAEAANDVDFQLQGEYFGQTREPNGRLGYTGLQVIALGEGKFDAVHYEGGLPGGGWNRSDKRRLSGERDGHVLTLVGDAEHIVIENDRATFLSPDGRPLGSIARIQRVSTRANAAPPRGAIVLFDGSHVDHFKGATMTDDGLLNMGTEFADAYQDFHLHIEFRLPYMPHARGQGRANSGCYLHGRYEVQVLDSFGLDGVKNECGALYTQRAPDVNMCFPPLRWQTYDITFTAPKFDAEGNKTANARITVLHNGVPVHDDVELTGKTGNGQQEGPQPQPIKLQNHGNPVVFRNVWLIDRTPRSDLVVR